MCKVFDNNDYIGLGGHKKQHLLFSLVRLILGYASITMTFVSV